MPAVLELLGQLQDGRKSEVSNLLRVTGGAGELRWIRNTSRCFAIPDSDGAAIDIVGCWVDITESKQEQLAVLFLDLDDLKTLNDSYGHVIGDEVLVEVAHRLPKGMRKSGTLAAKPMPAAELRDLPQRQQ